MVAVIKTGTGTLIFTGADPYTGGTTISAGTLQIGTGGSSTETSARTAPRRILDNGSLVFAGGNNYTYNNHQRRGRVTQAGSSTRIITLRREQRLHGRHTARRRRIGHRLGRLHRRGYRPHCLQRRPAGNRLRGGDQDLNSHAVNWSTFNGGFDVASGLTFTVSQAISGSGSLTRGGSNFGVLLLSGSNSYSGGMRVNVGTLRVGSTGAIPFGPGSGSTSVGASGYLDLAGLSITVNDLSGTAGGYILNSGTGTTSTLTVTAGVNTATTTFAGILENNAGSGGALALIKAGTGTLVLNHVNSLTGGVTVIAGQLTLSGGTGRITAACPITVAGGILDLGGTSQSATSAFSIQGGTVQNGTVVKTGPAYDGRSGTATAVLAGTAGLNKSTSGVLVLTNTNTYSGGTTLAGGELSVK